MLKLLNLLKCLQYGVMLGHSGKWAELHRHIECPDGHLLLILMLTTGIWQLPKQQHAHFIFLRDM